MLNANEIAARRKRRNLRSRTMDVLRALAGQQKQSKVAQVFLDLACSLDLTGPIDQSKLPATPDGFMVKQTSVLKNRGVSLSLLCLYQVVSMAVLYSWMYAATGDTQDARSCERYLDWLETYTKKPEAFSVVTGKRMESYLYPFSGDSEDKPHSPDWLQVNEGETI